MRKSAFVLTATDHGTMIVNRNDWRKEGPDRAVGVGIELLEQACYQPSEIDMVKGLLTLRHRYNGPGVIAIDGGANIGVHTVEWAKALDGIGQVIAIEPQERVFYALAGNIVLNNCHNAVAIHAALGDTEGVIEVPVPDYTMPGNFGGLELERPTHVQESGIGQDIQVSAPVRLMTLDSIDLPRVDLIKLDLEGMEVRALRGGDGMINEYRPVLIVEHGKSGIEEVVGHLEPRGYELFRFGGNFVACHRLDKCLDHVRTLHRELLKQQAGLAFDVEWVAFSRSVEAA